MNYQWIPILACSITLSAYANNVTHSVSNNTTFKEDSNVMSFAIIGDYGQDNQNEKEVAKLVDQRNPEFIITVGDNNYEDGCWDTIDHNIGKYYSDYIGNYKGDYGKGSKENRFFPSLGNHDWNAQEACPYKGGLPYHSYFTLPDNGFYYDFNKGSVHFFAIDSDPREPDGNKIDSKQYQWLKQKIKDSDACFKIVYFHHPAYSSGGHGSVKNLQWDFDKLGVDVVLAGHDHDYERLEIDDVTYYVNGTGGANIRKFKHRIKGSQFQYDKKNGYMMGYASSNQLKLSFYNTKDKEKDTKVFTKNCQ